MNSKFVFVREENLYGNGYDYDLRKSDFSDIIFPEVQNLPNWAKLLLSKKGFKTAKGNLGINIIVPKDDDYVDVTAPVYEFSNNGYANVCDEYTEKWSNPELAELAEKALKEVFATTKEQLYQIFMEMFDNNSIDGKIALFKMWHGYYVPNGNEITNDFIPDSIIKVYEDRITGVAYYMKKFDAEGKSVSIKVKDKENIKHIIGYGGKNIDRIAKIINACCIRVS